MCKIPKMESNILTPLVEDVTKVDIITQTSFILIDFIEWKEPGKSGFFFYFFLLHVRKQHIKVDSDHYEERRNI